MQYYLGIDVGSASVRAGVYGSNGTRIAFATSPIKQYHPKANFVEQSSADIWQQICTVTKQAIADAGIKPEQVRSIGFDATCSLVVCGDDGRTISVSQDGDPEHDIIMWMDHRADVETALINATNHDALRYVGGNVSIEMELPKVLWLKRNFPESYEKVWRFFDLADYLVWRSTGADAASVCTLTCKWNYLSHDQRWPEEMLAAVGLDDLQYKVPAKIMQLGEAAGSLTSKAAEELGLSQHVIVSSGIIDAHAGGLGLLGASPDGGLALISGTSNCHMIVNPTPKFVPGVWGPYFGAMLPDFWLGEGGQSAAGSLVEWTIHQCGSWPDLQEQATQTATHPIALLNDWVADLEDREPWPTKELHVLGDHHGNRSPRANPHARGAVSGLTLETGPDQMARLYLATLQAVAYGTRHILEEMTVAGHVIDTLYVCGGATKNALWLREYANITGCNIHLAEEEDVVTLGAAIMGAVACGDFASIQAASRALVKPGQTVSADPSAAEFHNAKYAVYLDLYENRERHAALMSSIS